MNPIWTGWSVWLRFKDELVFMRRAGIRFELLLLFCTGGDSDSNPFKQLQIDSQQSQDGMQAKLLQHHKSSHKISPIYSFCKFSADLKLKLKILLNEKSLKASNLINDILKFIRQIQKLGFRTEANDCIQCVVQGSRLAHPN